MSAAAPATGSPTTCCWRRSGARPRVAAALWLWGGLAGALFGSGWPRVGLGPAARRARPPARRAWPTRRARGRPPCRLGLPGAGGFYAALALLAGRPAGRASLLLGARPVRLSSGPARARGGPEPRGAAPAARLRAVAALRRGSCSGRHGGRLLYAEHRHALVAFGPPQSGKSAGIAIPALLEWDGPAVACSIKTDLLAAPRSRAAARSGEVFVFDPFGLVRRPRRTPGRRSTQRDTWDGALEVAWRLASAGELDRRSVEGGDFWAVAAEQRLAPLLYAAAASGAGMDSVVRWVHGQGDAGAATRPSAARGEPDERGGRRPRGLRRGPGVRGPGRPHAHLDRGDRPDAAARVPLRARRCARPRRARSRRIACSTARRRCT